MPEDLVSQAYSATTAPPIGVLAHGGEFTPIPGQIVSVRKTGHGVRPVAELSVRDRVLFRALTAVGLADWSLIVPESYEAFRRCP